MSVNIAVGNRSNKNGKLNVNEPKRRFKMKIKNFIFLIFIILPIILSINGCATQIKVAYNSHLESVITPNNDTVITNYNHYYIKSDIHSKNYDYTDSILSITWSISRNNNALLFKIKNNSNNPIAIKWNDVVYVGIYGNAQSVSRSGTPWYNSVTRSHKIQSSIPIPPHTYYINSIVPYNTYIEPIFSPGHGNDMSGNWILHTSIFRNKFSNKKNAIRYAKKINHKTISIYIPIIINKKTYTYQNIIKIDTFNIKGGYGIE